MGRSKLESRITVPTAGYSISVQEFTPAAGPATVTVGANTYYLTSKAGGQRGLLAQLQKELNDNGTLTGSYTVSVSDTTGKCTISASGVTTFNISWTSTILRDLLGFSSNQSGAATYTGNKQCRSLWMPDCDYQNLNGAHKGWIEGVKFDAESASGDVYSLFHTRKTVQSLTWPAIARAKTWLANETTDNESFETFLTDGIYGEAAWGTSAGPIRWCPDIDTQSTYFSYSVVGMGEWRPAQVRENYVGSFAISLPRLVADSSAGQDALLAAVSAVGLPKPTLAFDYSREASGSFANIAGTGTMSPTGTPLYSQAFPADVGGTAVKFDNVSSDRFALSDTSLGDPTGSIAVFVIFSCTSKSATFDEIVSKRNASFGPGFELMMNASGQVRFDVVDSLAAFTTITSSSDHSIGSDQWAGASRDQNAGSTYLATSLDAETSASDSTGNCSSNRPVAIGDDQRNAFGNGTGLIRYLLIWNGSSAEGIREADWQALFEELGG